MPLWGLHARHARADACIGQGAALHPALANADFSRTGFHGHSNGAGATQNITSYRSNVEKYNIKAGVAQHCGCPELRYAGCKNYGPSGSGVPFMYVSAAGDTIMSPDKSANGYDAAGDGPKVLWVVKGGSHFEPADLTIPKSLDGAGGANREDQPVALFFACHVRGEHCDEVYGSSGDAICRTAGTAMSQCKVHRGAPAPPGPAPQLYACKHNACVATASGLSKEACEAACGPQ